jgi:hypothetical protein
VRCRVHPGWFSRTGVGFLFAAVSDVLNWAAGDESAQALVTDAFAERPGIVADAWEPQWAEGWDSIPESVWGWCFQPAGYTDAGEPAELPPEDEPILLYRGPLSGVVSACLGPVTMTWHRCSLRGMAVVGRIPRFQISTRIGLGRASCSPVGATTAGRAGHRGVLGEGWCLSSASQTASS